MVYTAHPVFVLALVAPLNLVRGLLRLGCIKLNRGGHPANVLVEPRRHPPIKLVLGNVVDLSHPLRRVEVHRGEGQQDVVDR